MLFYKCIYSLLFACFLCIAGLRKSDVAGLGLGDVSVLKKEDDEIVRVSFVRKKYRKAHSFFVEGELFAPRCKEYFRMRADTQCKDQRSRDKGKLHRQVVGAKKLEDLPKEIARFLRLPNWKEFTTHSFKRSGSTTLAQVATVYDLQSYNSHKFATTSQRYIDNSVRNKRSISGVCCLFFFHCFFICLY
jgi:integrase